MSEVRANVPTKTHKSSSTGAQRCLIILQQGRTWDLEVLIEKKTSAPLLPANVQLVQRLCCFLVLNQISITEVQKLLLQLLLVRLLLDPEVDGVAGWDLCSSHKENIAHVQDLRRGIPLLLVELQFPSSKQSPTCCVCLLGRDACFSSNRRLRVAFCFRVAVALGFCCRCTLRCFVCLQLPMPFVLTQG